MPLTIRISGGRLKTATDSPLDAQRGQPDHVRERPRRHRFGSPAPVARAHQDQPIDEIRPPQRQLLGDEAAKRGAQDVGLPDAQMVQERHHVGHEVGDAAIEISFAPRVEGDGAKVAREGRYLLEEPPPPKTQAPYENQRRSLAVDVVVYAGVLSDRYGHAA